MKRDAIKVIPYLLIVLILFSKRFNVFAADCTQGYHEYEVSITSHADADHNGERKYACIYCGYSYTETIPSTGHYFGEYYIEQQPTCADEGLSYRTCVDCGLIEYQVLPITGEHSLGDWVEDSQPTCITDGSQNRVCRICGYTEQETLAAAGEHHYEVTGHPAACTEPGKMVYTCSVCQDTYTEVIKPLGHQYGKSIDVKAATKTQEGLAIRVCEHDENHVLEEIIPKLEVNTGADTVQSDCGDSNDNGLLNWRDVVLMIMNIGAFSIFFFLIWCDYQVIDWDRKQKLLLEKRGEWA